MPYNMKKIFQKVNIVQNNKYKIADTSMDPLDVIQN